MGQIKIAGLAVVIAITALCARGVPAYAASLTDPGVPHTINLQSMVFDAEGKVTKSESVDMTIRILDSDNNILFSEVQNDIVVVKGAINVNIGESSGGIPLDILDPSTGIKLIDIEIAGQSPFELMPLGALPYAMWAEKSLTVANDSIGTEQIKNGSIKAEDIDPLDFSAIQGIAGEGQIPTSMATDAELTAHASSTAAHPASAIVVSGSFVTFVADDVQEALQKLDAKLVDEIVNRQAGQVALRTDVTALQTATSNINNIPGTLGVAKGGTGANLSATGGANQFVRQNSAGGAFTVGAITDADVPDTITAGSATSLAANGSNCVAGSYSMGVDASGNAEGCTPDVDTNSGGTVTSVSAGSGLTGGPITISGSLAVDYTTLDGRYVNSSDPAGDTMTGELRLPDDASVLYLSGGNFYVGRTLRNHENRLGTLETRPTVPFSSVTGQIAEGQVPQFMRPFAFGNASPPNSLQSGSYNVASVSGNAVRLSVTFQNAAANANYVVMAVRNGPPVGGNNPLTVENKTTGGFEISGQTSVLPSVDFVVFGNF